MAIKKEQMKKASIIFPHQLFDQSGLPLTDSEVYLVEETLFFNQYKFHKQKLAFHRASMKTFSVELQAQNVKLNYIDAGDEKSDIRVLIQSLYESGLEQLHFIDPTDDWLSKRIKRSCLEHGIERVEYGSPLFINSKEELSGFFRADKKSFFQTSFYKKQRKERDILMDGLNQPAGGKWTYDVDCWGGGNNEHQCYTDKEQNVKLEDGFLKITALNGNQTQFFKIIKK